jgi:Lar family restriction alleviation protein
VTDALLPCPFCGNPPRDVAVAFSLDNGAVNYYGVECSNHDCDCSLKSEPTEQGAIARWNRRSGEQDAKDTALYRELLYAVSKKWPGESRHETALRYIRRAEEEGSKELAAAIRTQGTEG